MGERRIVEPGETRGVALVKALDVAIDEILRWNQGRGISRSDSEWSPPPPSYDEAMRDGA